jgi:hypothetical protein
MSGIDAVIVLKILVVGTIVAVAILLFLIFRYSRKLEDVGELGVSYMVKEKGSDRGFSLFRKLVETKGSHGLIVTRTYPEKIQKSEILEDTPIWWLSAEESPQSIDPVSLAKLTHVIREFIMNNECAVVFLDGLEYLIMHNGFETTLRFLQALNDLVILNRATLVIPVNPSSLSVREMSLLEKEVEIHQLSIKIRQFFGE